MEPADGEASCGEDSVSSEKYAAPVMISAAISKAALSIIGSVVGNPLFADRRTELCDCLAYARICVDISSEDLLPEVITIEDDEGSTFFQPFKADNQIATRLPISPGHRPLSQPSDSSVISVSLPAVAAALIPSLSSSSFGSAPGPTVPPLAPQQPSPPLTAYFLNPSPILSTQIPLFPLLLRLPPASTPSDSIVTLDGVTVASPATLAFAPPLFYLSSSATVISSGILCAHQPPAFPLSSSFNLFRCARSLSILMAPFASIPSFVQSSLSYSQIHTLKYSVPLDPFCEPFIYLQIQAQSMRHSHPSLASLLISIDPHCQTFSSYLSIKANGILTVDPPPHQSTLFGDKEIFHGAVQLPPPMISGTAVLTPLIPDPFSTIVPWSPSMVRLKPLIPPPP
ncbi:hypothetical protein NE237_027754 [Protea cynaroides]|uniref:Uncharacterized protein n=1 Tax=Protea cynaroides TaxID=273540 RepID=A0A9Q0GRY9_9MAGN|nr:hypothetical protein NE237_027754 [Protea cynaroides]